MPGTNLAVKTHVFEGPLDLLLDLIERRKLLINDISLASVTDEFLSRVKSIDMPVGDTAEFVSLAATLLLIKSRSLLPFLELSGEEEQDIKQLQYRLAVYQVIKNAARGLATPHGTTLYEGEVPSFEPLFVPDSSITPDALRGAANVLMESFPELSKLPAVQVKRIVSLEEMVERLTERVSSAFRLSFKEFSGMGKGGEVARGEVIVSFLALLELVKQGIIRATQEAEFGDITLESDSVSEPTY